MSTRHKSYGEIAFNSWKSLRNDSVSAVWDNQSQSTQDVWENIAASVIVAFRQRQSELSHQSAGLQSQSQEQHGPIAPAT